MNATADSALRQNSAITPGEEKPEVSASMTAKISVASAAAPKTPPAMSMLLASRSAFSGRNTTPAANAATPNVTSNQKMARQSQTPTSAPPMTGPSASDSPDTAAHTPSARFLS